jgi:NDP-sugar pyrophosphorylase family protein
VQAVILAAGLGKRFDPHSRRTPKPMFLLHGHPILEYTFQSLPDAINRVVIVIHHLGEQIQRHFGEAFGDRRIVYVRQAELNGTADALFVCQQRIESDRFLVCMGDDLYSKDDLSRCLEHDLAILTCEHPEPSRFGVIEVDKLGHFVGIEEKPAQPKNNLVNTGVYVLDKEIFSYPRLKPERSNEDSLPLTLLQLAPRKPIKVVKASFWLPISYPEDLKRAEEVLRQRMVD